jgi:predicted hotdog family 3-hydroxylacyl-ACP dehydratase
MNMLTQQAWAALIPHAGAMALLDAVAEWDATAIHAIAERHTHDSHPLRNDAGLHAIHLAEYGAQAMAVHGALLEEARAREGRLVSLRDVRLVVECVDLSRGRLDVHAERIFSDSSGAQYAFWIEQCGDRLASGRAVVMHTL